MAHQFSIHEMIDLGGIPMVGKFVVTLENNKMTLKSFPWWLPEEHEEPFKNMSLFQKEGQWFLVTCGGIYEAEVDIII